MKTATTISDHDFIGWTYPCLAQSVVSGRIVMFSGYVYNPDASSGFSGVGTVVQEHTAKHGHYIRKLGDHGKRWNMDLFVRLPAQSSVTLIQE